MTVSITHVENPDGSVTVTLPNGHKVQIGAALLNAQRDDQHHGELASAQANAGGRAAIAAAAKIMPGHGQVASELTNAQGRAAIAGAQGTQGHATLYGGATTYPLPQNGQAPFQHTSATTYPYPGPAANFRGAPAPAAAAAGAGLSNQSNPDGSVTITRPDGSKVTVTNQVLHPGGAVTLPGQEATAGVSGPLSTPGGYVPPGVNVPSGPHNIGPDGTDWTTLQAFTDAGYTPDQIRQVAAGYTFPNGPKGAAVGPQATNSGGLTGDQQGAFDTVKGLLHDYGLDGLADWVKNEVIHGASAAQIVQDLRQTPEYKARFPGMELRQTAGLNAMSEQQYLDYENTARQLFRSAGIDGFFGTTGYLGGLIGHDVSPTELQARVNDGLVKVTQSDPTVRDWFQRNFGVQAGDRAFTAYFLDPDHAEPQLLRQVAASQVGGAGERYGYTLDQNLGLRLADSNISQNQAQQGFAQLRQLDPLFQESAGETRDLDPLNEGVNAVFSVGDGAADIDQRLKARQTMFSGGGGASGETGGLVGSGSAH